MKGINIYEVYNSGSVNRIWARDSIGKWIVVWQSSSVQYLTYSRVFSPNITVILILFYFILFIG